MIWYDMMYYMICDMICYGMIYMMYGMMYDMICYDDMTLYDMIYLSTAIG